MREKMGNHSNLIDMLTDEKNLTESKLEHIKNDFEEKEKKNL